MSHPAAPNSNASSEQDGVDNVVARARIAQQRFEKNADQQRYDQAALAAAWALMEPARNQELAEMAVAMTGLGNVPDKITKNHRKTLGLLRDIKDIKTTGVIAEIPELGMTEIGRPIGVIGAVVPSTNPVATPTNNIINALKCGNAIVVSPSPKGNGVCAKLLEYIYAEFAKNDINPDLVQMLPAPASKVKTQRLMEKADLLVVTGSQDNVRRAYSSGTPAVGVGAGNVTVIIDETADLQDAATKIVASKTFDNATSCSSENSLIVVDKIYDEFMAELNKAGAVLLDRPQSQQLVEALWQNGHLNSTLIASDIQKMVVAAKLEGIPDTAKLLAIETEGVGDNYPLSGEKLSLALAIYKARDLSEASQQAASILAHQGAGHSIGLHTTEDSRAVGLALSLPTCRVIVNQAHCFATGGSFDNGMPFSLSMGCGSWGGNSIDDNLHWRHFMNVTKVVRTIPPNEPSLEDIFGNYWYKKGK